MSLETILEEIKKERSYQDFKWGTAFDNKNTVNDWATYANIYLSKATTMKATPTEQRDGILKAATLLIAAIEAYDRNNSSFPKRHYDE